LWTIVILFVDCVPDFSFNDWLQAKGENIGDQLSDAGRDALVELLGLNDLLLSPPCDRKRSPYSPSLKGWNNCKTFILLFIVKVHDLTCNNYVICFLQILPYL
jgi:hypothetical protein